MFQNVLIPRKYYIKYILLRYKFLIRLDFIS